jgi:hypothetical protein
VGFGCQVSGIGKTVISTLLTLWQLSNFSPQLEGDLTALFTFPFSLFPFPLPGYADSGRLFHFSLFPSPATPIQAGFSLTLSTST